jgi:hypothetical protein
LNPLQPYEQTIATKLDALPLPDMADVIWADIAAQLDVDLPGGDDAPPPGNPPTGGGTTWATGIKLAIGAAGIALVAYWLTQLQNPSLQSSPAQSIPAEQKVIVDDTAQPVQPVTNNPNAISPVKNQPPTNDNIQLDNPAPLPMMADSLRLQPVDVAPIKMDSTTAPANTPPLVLPPPGKKKRGTQGIKDSDYKLVPGKDTT